MSFANLFAVTGPDGKATGTQYMRKTASYKLSEMYDTNGKDTATPYFDVILFSSAGLVSGADAKKEGALNGDVELSFYVDQTAGYNTALNWDPQSTDTTLPAKCLAKFYDEEKAKAANAKISRYMVKGSDLRLETMTAASDSTASKTTFWSLSKSMQKPYYDQEIDKSVIDANWGSVNQGALPLSASSKARTWVNATRKILRLRLRMTDWVFFRRSPVMPDLR